MSSGFIDGYQWLVEMMWLFSDSAKLARKLTYSTCPIERMFVDKSSWQVQSSDCALFKKWRIIEWLWTWKTTMETGDNTGSKIMRCWYNGTCWQGWTSGVFFHHSLIPLPRFVCVSSTTAHMHVACLIPTSLPRLFRWFESHGLYGWCTLIRRIFCL